MHSAIFRALEVNTDYQATTHITKLESIGKARSGFGRFVIESKDTGRPGPCHFLEFSQAPFTSEDL